MMRSLGRRQMKLYQGVKGNLLKVKAHDLLNGAQRFIVSFRQACKK
jgi:hypothetical protein